MDVFLKQIAKASERGDLEVHAFALLTTHYHMLVRSPVGRLAHAMQRVQTEYSRWFNRGRKRDGPLVRGRYAAKQVDSLTYRRAVVRYIDRNPVSAGLATRAADYPHGSARYYTQGGTTGLGLLERGWVEEEVCRAMRISTYEPTKYHQVFGDLPNNLARVVEARFHSRMTEGQLETLLCAAPSIALAWMRRKAQLADGTDPGLPVLAWNSIHAAMTILAIETLPSWRIGRRSAWQVIKVGLARQFCGLGFEEIGTHVGLGPTAAGNLARLHNRLVQSNDKFAQLSGAAASRALGAWKSGVK